MAMKIRCTGCRRKISIDEAFAGSVCRCPYCKTINVVAGKAARRTVFRPYAPPGLSSGRPDTPMAAAEREAVRRQAKAEPAIATPEEHIPMARPVKIQGIVSLVLIGMIALMIGVLIYMVVLIAATREVQSKGGLSGDSGYTNPLGERAGTIAGMTISAPVIYVLDGGAGMSDTFHFARTMTISSAKSLGEDQKFTVLIANANRGDRWLPAEGLSPADKNALASLKTFVGDYTPQGSAGLLAALAKALDRAEKLKGTSAVKAIVLITSRAFDDDQQDRAVSLAERAKKLGIVITTLGMTDSATDAERLKKIAESTGGRSASYSLDALINWDEQRKMMEE